MSYPPGQFPYPPPPQFPPTPPAPRRRQLRQILVIIAAALAGIVGIGIVASIARGDAPSLAGRAAASASPSATFESNLHPNMSSTNEADGVPDATQSPAPPPSTPPPSTTSPQSTTPPPPVPPPTPDFAAVTFSGSGDDVVSVPPHPGTFLIVDSYCECGGNFVVKSDDPGQLIVNEIGAYSGTGWLDIRDGDLTTMLEVNADGPWTITLRDASTATIVTSGVPAAGEGDLVYLWLGNAGIAEINCQCDGNFVVTTAGSRLDLVVNEIGVYSGRTPWDDGVFVQVIADGPWTIVVTET